MTDSPRSASPAAPVRSRRGMMASLAALGAGAVVLVTPLASALVTLFDPVRRAGKGGEFLRITTLANLPADGKPHTFPVVLPQRDDAWTQYRDEPVGAIHLLRTPEGAVQALSATCPHAGCLIPFQAETGDFRCPCHRSAFDLNGARVDPKSSPSPRDMDTLICEVRGGEVWVEYQNFQIATEEKKPRA